MCPPGSLRHVKQCVITGRVPVRMQGQLGAGPPLAGTPGIEASHLLAAAAVRTLERSAQMLAGYLEPGGQHGVDTEMLADGLEIRLERGGDDHHRDAGSLVLPEPLGRVGAKPVVDHVLRVLLTQHGDLAGRPPSERSPDRLCLQHVAVAPGERRHGAVWCREQTRDQSGHRCDPSQERHHAVARGERPVEVESGDNARWLLEVEHEASSCHVAYRAVTILARLPMLDRPRARLAGVPLVEQLRSFHRRRIALPVSDGDLVLDVGSGDKPSWRADVLVERYLGAEHAGQRSGGDEARVTRPLFDADADDLPFADGAFDYVICSHVLEHVPDPAKVVAELTRVARAGYIEVPEAASAKIVDFPSHLWWVRLDESTTPQALVFTAKSAPYFDAEIHDYLQRSGLERRITNVLDSRFDHRIISLPWENTVNVRVEGQVSDDLLKHALHADTHHRTTETLAARTLTSALTYRQRRRRPPPKNHYNDVVKPEHQREDNPLLKPGIYQVAEN